MKQLALTVTKFQAYFVVVWGLVPEESESPQMSVLILLHQKVPFEISKVTFPTKERCANSPNDT
jgi:hypothetical protein